MTGLRHLTSAVAAAVVLTGCSSGRESPRTMPSSTPSPATDDPTPWLLPSTSGAGPTRSSPGPGTCPTPGAAVVPDGAWDGPLRLRARAVAGVPATRSTGTGRLQVLVQGGQVVQGAWTARWRSTGHGTTEEGDVVVRLTTEVAGTVRGPATRPVVHHAWAVSGIVRTSTPVTAVVPVSASGDAGTWLAVRTRSCDVVVGTLALAATGKDPRASLTGTVRWVARRVG